MPRREECGQEFEGRRGDLCPQCGSKTTTESITKSGDLVHHGLPWEQRDQLGFLSAMVKTVICGMSLPSLQKVDKAVAITVNTVVLLAVAILSPFLFKLNGWNK